MDLLCFVKFRLIVPADHFVFRSGGLLVGQDVYPHQRWRVLHEQGGRPEMVRIVVDARNDRAADHVHIQ